MTTGEVLNVIDPDLLGLEVVTWLPHGEVMARCPWHGGTSMTVSLTRGLFLCFGCAEAGPVEELARVLGGHLVRQPVRVRGSTEQQEGWQQLLVTPLALGDPYLAERGVTDQQVQRHGLRRHQRGVVIPLPSYLGQPVGVLMRQVGQYRGPKYLLLGQRPLLWPLPELRRYATQRRLDDKHRFLILTEGVFGALSAERAGYRGLALLGAGVSQEVVQYLGSRGEQLLVCTDHDQAGYVGALRLLSELPLALTWAPALEADELQPVDWEAAVNDPTRWTRHLADLLRVTPNKDDLLKVARRLAQRRARYG